jgi:feruloyl esterase
MFYRVLVVLGACALTAAAQTACDGLTKLMLPGVTVTSAVAVSAGPFTLPAGRGAPASPIMPSFCRVIGFVRPEVNFEVWLPANWNRKFLMVGNGGLAGTISFSAMVAPLQRGYATASTDTGHVADNDGHWAQGHMQRVIDFAHRGVHVTTEAGKAIVQQFYGVAAEHSYFSGCSQGGQEALTEVQRYPTDYDGVIAGDPANYWTHLYMGGHMWITQALQNDPAAYLPSGKTQIIGNAVNAACDDLDGIKDGILSDPRRCHFDPATLLCKGSNEAKDAPDCLTAAQVDTVRKIYQGARTPDGEQIFPGIMPGGEAGQTGWASWITGAAPGRGQHSTLGNPFFRYVVFEDPDWDFRSFHFDKVPGFDSDVEFTDDKLASIFNNMNPDIKAFQISGGKLIQYHGWSDPDISPLNSVNYFQSVNEKMGDTKSFYRLFMVPGMNHCSGGPGPNTFDPISALEQWVERGKAPERIVATGGAVKDRTRPLCPFPQEARWKGTGTTDKEENFICAAPGK